jgi:cytochrome P450
VSTAKQTVFTRPPKACHASDTTGSELPPGLPLPAATQTYIIWRWPFAYLEWCRAHYGSRFTLRMTGFPPLVFLSDPADIRALFAAPSDTLRPGEGGAITTPIVGTKSFMLQDGDEHITARKTILPSFHKSAVQLHADMVTEVARQAIAAWPRDVAFALHSRLRTLTLEIILRTMFTSPPHTSVDRSRALRETMLRTFAITGSAVFPEPILRHSPLGRAIWLGFLRNRAETDELIYALIDERRRSGREDTTTDMLDVLLTTADHDRPLPSRQQLRDNVMSVILAGHETTAAQLSWAFQLLAHNPVVLDRLRNEIDQGEDDKYLTATIHEVLRHRPVFLFAIPRAVNGSVEIGDWTYCSPAQLLSCIYLVHHDPAIYAEPDVFRPERFLSPSPPPHVWLPWGGGRRRCPGMNLAMLEMKTVLRTVLSELTVLPATPDIERPRWRSVIVTPHAGSRIVLRTRVRRHLPRSPRSCPA